MNHAKLKSGMMVTLHQVKLDGPIYARRSPESLRGPRSQAMEKVVITTIPSGSRALYMGTHEDAFNTALRQKGRGPYGYTPAQVFYHFVLWEGRPVWVASSDCALEELKDAPTG